jgi:hypothetical protein
MKGHIVGATHKALADAGGTDRCYEFRHHGTLSDLLPDPAVLLAFEPADWHPMCWRPPAPAG